MRKPFEYETLALGVLAIAAVTLLVWWLLARAAGRARRRFNALLELAQSSLDAPSDIAAASRRLTALRLVVNAAKYALTLSALLMALRWLGVPLDSLLLPAGFLGAALGLGAQNMVRDIVAGLFIVFEGQFAVGDVVSINGTVGVVDEIGLRVTRLRAESGHLHFFPNGAITAVEKYPRGHIVLRLCVPLAGAAPVAAPPDSEASHSTPALAAEARPFDEEAAAAVIMDAIRRFAADYGALDGAAEIVREDDAGAGDVGDNKAGAGAARTLCFRLPVRPLRAAATREKLPPRVAVALEAAGARLMAGAEVSVFNAPDE